MPIEAKFHMESPWDGGTKVYSNGPGHMTKMETMPIYGKNLLLQNQKADDLETWYATSSALLEAVYMDCFDIQVLDLYVKTCINTAIS